MGKEALAAVAKQQPQHPFPALFSVLAKQLSGTEVQRPCRDGEENRCAPSEDLACFAGKLLGKGVISNSASQGRFLLQREPQFQAFLLSITYFKSFPLPTR